MDSPFFFEGTRYWSAGDERCHFEWMARIGPVRSVKGVGRRVYLDIDVASVGPLDLFELDALYRRYRGDRGQLKPLASAEFKPFPIGYLEAEESYEISVEGNVG